VVYNQTGRTHVMLQAVEGMVEGIRKVCVAGRGKGAHGSRAARGRTRRKKACGTGCCGMEIVRFCCGARKKHGSAYGAVRNVSQRQYAQARGSAVVAAVSRRTQTASSAQHLPSSSCLPPPSAAFGGRRG